MCVCGVCVSESVCVRAHVIIVVVMYSEMQPGQLSALPSRVRSTRYTHTDIVVRPLTHTVYIML